MGGVHSSATGRRARAERQRAESSRVLFLLYLVHRTWNVLMDHVDTKSSRWRGSHAAGSHAAGAGARRGFDSVSVTDSCCSTCSSCRQECAQDCVR